MLIDRNKGEPAEYIEFSTIGEQLREGAVASLPSADDLSHLLSAPAPTTTTTTTTATAADVASPVEEGPEPDPPEPFEYPFTD